MKKLGGIKSMKTTLVNLEMLIKSYAKTTSENGIFISFLEYDENLKNILNLSNSEMIDLVDSYLYLTDFKDVIEMNELFSRIENESHPDAQYAVLVNGGEIVKEFYYGA